MMMNNWDDDIMNQVFRDYLNATDSKKHIIFNRRIFPVFIRLINDEFNTHKINLNLDSIEDTENNCLTFLFESIHKFNPDKIWKDGKKINSKTYFSMMVRCFIADNNKRNYDEKRKRASLEEYEE